MARPKSDYLKSAGKAFEVLKVIADAVLDNGGSDEDLARVLTDKQLARDVGQRIVRDIAENLTAFVNYDRSIADGVAAGQYDWKNSDVTEAHFPRCATGTRDVEFQLVHFGKNIQTADAIAELERRGLRPATLQELLAVGEQHPEKQNAFPIIALGSVWLYLGGYRCVPYLGRDGSLRELDLHWYGRDWYDLCRFLAVRK